jgi:hypothetical protein
MQMNTQDEFLETEDPPHITNLNGSDYIRYLETFFNLELRGRRSPAPTDPPSRTMTPVSPNRTMTLRPRTATIFGDEYYVHN